MNIKKNDILFFGILLIVDIILLSLIVLKYGLDDESFFVGIGGLLIINLLIILFLKAFQEKQFVNYFWINLFISPIILNVLVMYLTDYRVAANKKMKSFSYRKAKFVVVIHRYDSAYDFFKLIDSSYQFVQNGKLVYNDTITLVMMKMTKSLKFIKILCLDFPKAKTQ